MRDQSLWPGYYILIHLKQDFGLVVFWFICFRPSGNMFMHIKTRTSLPEMRSDGTLWETDMLTRSRVINQDVFNLWF